MRKQKHQNKRITNKEKQTLTEDMQKIFVAVTLRKNQDGEKVGEKHLGLGMLEGSFCIVECYVGIRPVGN